MSDTSKLKTYSASFLPHIAESTHLPCSPPRGQKVTHLITPMKTQIWTIIWSTVVMERITNFNYLNANSNNLKDFWKTWKKHRSQHAVCATGKPLAQGRIICGTTLWNLYGWKFLKIISLSLRYRSNFELMNQGLDEQVKKIKHEQLQASYNLYRGQEGTIWERSICYH